MSVFAWPYLQPLYNTHLRLHPHPANDDAGAASLAHTLRPRRQQRRRPAPFTPLPPSPALQPNNNARHPTKPPHRRCTSRAAPPSPLHQPSPQHCCPAVTEQPLSRPDTAGQTQPVSPSNRTRPATSTQSRHLVISSAGAQNPCGLCLLSPAARLRVGDGFQSQPMSRRQRGRQLPRAPR